MSSKSKIIFEQVLNDFRNDLNILHKLNGVMISRLNHKVADIDTRNWIMDVYADKILELEHRMDRITKEMLDYDAKDFDYEVSTLLSALHSLAFESNWMNIQVTHIPRVEKNIDGVIKAADREFLIMRRSLWHEDWKGIDKIKPVEYINSERKKYVTAREELQKAKEGIENNSTDVMLHLRGAIDLSIKERFGFTKIHPMIVFFKDADKLGFPLPSYDLIYDYFNEGSERIHNGKISTPFEAKEAVRTVSNFIDALEIIEVEQSKIDDFKSKCRAVE